VTLTHDAPLQEQKRERVADVERLKEAVDGPWMRCWLSSVQQDEERPLASEKGDEQTEEAAVESPMTCLWDQHA
jgi:hypothetical protein